MKKEVIERYALVVKNDKVEETMDKISKLEKDGFYFVSRKPKFKKGGFPVYSQQEIVLERLIEVKEDSKNFGLW